MAAITISHDISEHGRFVARTTLAGTASLALESVAILEDYWSRFGRFFVWTATFFALFLFFGSFALVVAAGGSAIGGLAVGGMAALWGTPCFGALFAANLASQD